MVNAVATRSFLLKQEELGNGLKKDVMTKRGERIQLSEREAISFWGGIRVVDNKGNRDEKRERELVKLGKTSGWKRRI